MRDPSIIFPELWIAQCTINNLKDIIDQRAIYNAMRNPRNYGLHTKGDTIHNPRDIIDEESIHNVPKIMDWNGAFIMQRNYG